jgi:regulatory protein
MSLSNLTDEERAMQSALRLLGYRARSVQELRQRLERKAFAPAIIARTLRELTRLGLLDDREFAHSWVQARRGYGPVRLRQDLLQKGIPRNLAEEAISTGLSADDELAVARQVAQRALRTLPTPVDLSTLARLRRMLQRRGFSYEVIGRVCARLSDRVTAEGDWLE